MTTTELENQLAASFPTFNGATVVSSSCSFVGLAGQAANYACLLLLSDGTKQFLTMQVKPDRSMITISHNP